MLHPSKEVLQERSSATGESFQNAVESMKQSKTTGCICLYMPEGVYTIAFLDGEFITVFGPLDSTLDVLLDRCEQGEICTFSVEKKIFSSYIGYLREEVVQTGNGLPLSDLLVELVKRKHTGTIEVTNSSEEGLIFLEDGIPETAFYSDDGRYLSSTEALESIMKMAEAVDPDITVYDVVGSVEPVAGSVLLSDMKMRGFFFNAIKSHIEEKMGKNAGSLFNKRIGRSRYIDLVMYPLEEFLRATEIANNILGYSDFELGKTVYPDFRKSILGRLVFFVGNVNTPFKLARIAQLAWRVSVNYGERWIEEESDGKIVIRMKNDGDRCERLRGILAGAMESIGYICTVRETECEKRGGRFCEFVVEWDAG
jgi:uncharacterized protein (TIGR02265 family)